MTTGTKLAALQCHLADQTEHFLWMDYISIPQAAGSREQQTLAITSIPTYFMYSTTMLVVAPTGYFEDTERGYLSRGHCLLELATSRLPRIDMFGKWYIPGSEKTGQWGSVIILDLDTNESERLENAATASRSPVAGNFTVEADRELVSGLIEKYVQHHEFIEAQVLAPLRQCESLAEYERLDLPDCLRLQCFSASWLGGGEGMKPAEWLERVLPAGHLEALRDSLAATAGGAE